MYSNGTETPDRFWVKKGGITFAYKALRTMCEEERFSTEKMRAIVNEAREAGERSIQYGEAVIYLQRPHWFIEPKDNQFPTWTLPKAPSGKLIAPHSYDFATWG